MDRKEWEEEGCRCSSWILERLGKAFLADRQKQVFIATKFGVRLNLDGTRKTRNGPEYIRMAVDKKLEEIADGLRRSLLLVSTCSAFRGRNVEYCDLVKPPPE